MTTGQLVAQRGESPSGSIAGGGFRLEDKQFSGPVTVSEVSGPNAKSEKISIRRLVKTVERAATAEARRLRYTSRPIPTPCSR